MIMQLRTLIQAGCCGLLLATGIAMAEDRKPPALDFPNDVSWFNVSRPLTLDDLHGRLVLLDFWTYGCINCLHVADELAQLEQEFGDDLLVIGVHSPKFSNERRDATLRSFLIRNDRRHPVVNDTRSQLMREYGVFAWPTLVLLDPDTRVVGYAPGEGNVEVLASEMRGQLALADSAVLASRKSLPLSPEADRVDDTLLAAPGKIASRGDDIAISDSLHNQVLITDIQGTKRLRIGSGAEGFRDGDATEAMFRNPQGLTFTGDRLIVADTGNHAIRSIDLATHRVTTLAGTGRVGFSLDGGDEATTVPLRSPWDVAAWRDQVFVAMAGSHQIWRLDHRGKSIKPWAGTGKEGIKDGTPTQATFSQPSGLTVHDDKLFVADAEASAIRMIDLDRNTVETLIGRGLHDFGDRDSKAANALLQHALGVAFLGDRLLIADTYNHKLKALDLDTRVVTTLLGSGDPGNVIEGRMRAELNEPGGLTVTGGKVFIADTNNNRVLVYNPDSRIVRQWLPSVSPQTDSDPR